MTARLRWVAFALLLLGFIVLPFLLLEDSMNAWTERQLSGPGAWWRVTVAVVGFLLLDIVLPVPSSFVLTTAGFLLGPVEGALAGFVGLTCAAWAGYGLGRWAGRPAAERIVGRAELQRLDALVEGRGALLLVACRGLPVVAEATALLAGVSRLAPWRFTALVSLGNAVVALLYAGIGAAAATQASALLVSVAGMGLPLLLWWAWRRFTGA